MGKKWDDGGVGKEQQAWHVNWLSEVFRVLQPGGIVKAFGATRTYHWMGAAMEEIGFIDVGLDVWGYGTGWPKGLNISKAMDKAQGAEREVIVVRTMTQGGGNALQMRMGEKREVEANITAAASPDAKTWEGWNTALRPSWEPVVVGKKPL